MPGVRIISIEDGSDGGVSAMPFNGLKPSEFAQEAAVAPLQGMSVEPCDQAATGRALTEANLSDKVGSGAPPIGVNKTIAPLDRVRVDSSGQRTTTNDAPRRLYPAREDHALRIERTLERIVYARDSAAHGFFDCYESMARSTRAHRHFARESDPPLV